MGIETQKWRERQRESEREGRDRGEREKGGGSGGSRHLTAGSMKPLELCTLRKRDVRCASAGTSLWPSRRSQHLQLCLRLQHRCPTILCLLGAQAAQEPLPCVTVETISH